MYIDNLLIYQKSKSAIKSILLIAYGSDQITERIDLIHAMLSTHKYVIAVFNLRIDKTKYTKRPFKTKPVTE